MATSPSEPAPAGAVGAPPPEILAIAVALAALWPGAQLAAEGAAVARPGPWRWAGRRWEREAGHRWS